MLVVVPTLALLDQWRVAFQEDLGVSENEIACFGGGYSPPTKPLVVNIAVVNTARVVAGRLVRSMPGPWMLVADECHRYGSPVNKAVLELPYRWTLGLSATPEREFDTGFEEYLQPRVGQIIFQYDYAAAKRDGVISPFALWNYKVPLTPKEDAAYEAISEKIRKLQHTLLGQYKRWGLPVPSLKDMLASQDDPSVAALRRYLLQRRSIAIRAAYRLPAAARIATQFRQQQVLLFHERIEDANRLDRLLEQVGLRTAVYHSKLSPVQRSLNLLLFRRGAVGSLVTCRALDEGLDVPGAEIGILVASTRSTRQRIQRLGRVLRRAPGKTLALVCTLYATEAEAEDLRAEAGRLQDVAEIKWFTVDRPRLPDPKTS